MYNKFIPKQTYLTELLEINNHFTKTIFKYIVVKMYYTD